MRDFTDKKYDRWKKRMAFILAKVGRAQDAEDAVNEFCARLLEGKSQHQTLEQFAIDYLREVGGRKGSCGYSQKQKLINAGSYEQADLFGQLGFDPRRDVDTRIDLERCSELAGNGIDGQVFKLYYFEGLGEGEIADRFGVTPSRISQRLERVEGRIRKGIARPRSRFERETARAVAQVLRISWAGMELEADQRMAFEEPRSMEATCRPSYEEWIA